MPDNGNIIKGSIIPTHEPKWSPPPLAGESTLVHNDYKLHEAPHFGYDFDELDSFISYCREEYQPEQCLILWNPQEILALRKRDIPGGDYVKYCLRVSPELKAWQQMQRVNIMTFRRFLEPRLHEVKDTSIFDTLSSLKMNVMIKFESSIEDDRNYGFLFEQKDQKGSSVLPKEIWTELPFFAGDDPQDIPFILSISHPTNDQEKPMITLSIFGYEILLRENTRRCIKKIAKALPEFLILAGSKLC